MINLIKAEEAFKNYVSNYKVADEKIEIKIKHTFGVVNIAGYIASQLGLSEEDILLAKLIGLLHDIGRFEQAVRFNNYDDFDTIDHADFGADLLFKENLIEKFTDDRNFDKIIEVAIRNHNKFEIEDGLTERELLHSKIIRDADKTDNFEVKQYQDLMSLLDETKEEAEKGLISDDVWEDFLAGKTIISSKRITSVDKWISYIAWVFDYNYNPGLRYLKENNSIDKVIDRLEYTEKDTKEKMEMARIISKKYIDKRLEE